MGGKYERVIAIARELDKCIYGSATEVSKSQDELMDELHELLGQLPEDEPIFILRAQDRAAPRGVRFWTLHAKQIGADNPTVGSGVRSEADMLEWQDKNPSKVKVPTTSPLTG